MVGKRLRSWAKSLAGKLKRRGGRDRLDSEVEESRSRGASLVNHFEQGGGGANGLDSKVEELHSRAKFLAAKFKQGDGSNHIDEAIVLDREALGLCPPGHHLRCVSLTWLSVHLSDRYTQLGELVDVEEATVLDREALALLLPGHPDYSMSLNNLANRLGARYDQLGATGDLNEAIVLDRKVLALRPPEHPDRATSLNNLGVRLSTRFNKLGEMDDLIEAIHLDQEALALCPAGHSHRPIALNNLAVRLSTRFSQLGAMEDLIEAIVLDREALALRPPGHPDHSMSLNNLANRLGTRYDQLGSTDDLNEAISLGRQALALRPPGHPDRSMSLNNLAVRLCTRFNQLGAMDDLIESISLDREALTLRPPGHPDCSMSLNNLAARLRTRFNHLGEMDDLNEAIVLGRRALALRPAGHPGRSHSLKNLAKHLTARYNKLQEMHDLDEAIVLGREALALRPPGNPGRSNSLNSLAKHLTTRYSRLQEMDDLNEAIVLGREALALRPLGHPNRTSSLDNLARHLDTRFRRSHQPSDKEELFTLYAQLANMPQMVSSADLSAARAWISVAEDFHHPTTVVAYETSLRSLIHHLATLPSLPQHLDVLKSRTSSLAVDAFSACLRNHSPTKAVELIEQGRGVFWSQFTRLRSPVDDVVASGPAGEGLAEKFTHLTSLIRNALRLPGPDQHDRVCRLNVKLQMVVEDIRRLRGLSRFLLPSLFSDLQEAARGGPVIILNASKYGCDALIVLFDRNPVHIPLRITKDRVIALSSAVHALTVRAKMMNVTREFAATLRDIWDEVVSPITDFLRIIHPSRSRIWWCPTAEFSPLPLHAAGPYRKGERKLSDLYISSYTPSLTALIHARRHEPSNYTAQRRRFVAIGQANAKGERELPFVDAEVANIGQRVNGLVTFTRIEGSESCISLVSEALGKNEWVHFACHGIPNRKRPFESAFALHDGRFTIEHIMRCEPQNAQFAYLSACHTTVGDEKCPDEMIHLASAMQHAGFRSVIGTMWAVDDRQTKRITSMFYDNMIDESGQLDHTRAAYALHKTMRTLEDVSFDQRILYIHLGA